MKVTEWTCWNDDRFLDINNMTNEEFDAAREAVKEELRTNKYKFSGSVHQHMNNCVPVIDNKWLFAISMRSWGRIIQEAYDLPNENGMGYITWA